jgi:hypothetical protein
MLNIAGPEYDFGSVVYAVLQECEHHRRSFDEEGFADSIERCAKEKLDQVRKAYDEFGGSELYWKELQKEVLGNVVSQYTEPALEITQLERSGWSLWRKGDLGARLGYALVGLVVGSAIIAIPWIPIFENMFAFALTAGGFLYPDLKRFVFERRYARTLNKLINDSAAYQEQAGLHYLTAVDIQQSFQPAEPKKLDHG